MNVLRLLSTKSSSRRVTLGFRRRIFNVVDQPRQHQNLALAQKLLCQAGFKLLDFLR